MLANMLANMLAADCDDGIFPEHADHSGIFKWHGWLVRGEQKAMPQQRRTLSWYGSDQLSGFPGTLLQMREGWQEVLPQSDSFSEACTLTGHSFSGWRLAQWVTTGTVAYYAPWQLHISFHVVPDGVPYGAPYGVPWMYLAHCYGFNDLNLCWLLTWYLHWFTSCFWWFFMGPQGVYPLGAIYDTDYIERSEISSVSRSSSTGLVIYIYYLYIFIY